MIRDEWMNNGGGGGGGLPAIGENTKMKTEVLLSSSLGGISTSGGNPEANHPTRTNPLMHGYRRSRFNSSEVIMMRSGSGGNGGESPSFGHTNSLGGDCQTLKLPRQRARTLSENNTIRSIFHSNNPWMYAQDEQEEDEYTRQRLHSEDSASYSSTTSHNFSRSNSSDGGYGMSGATGTGCSGSGGGPGTEAGSNSDHQSMEKLLNLQKLYQEGFITVTEFKERRLQLVDEMTMYSGGGGGNGSRSNCNGVGGSGNGTNGLPIIYHSPPDFTKLKEKDAIKHVFDLSSRKWSSCRIKVKIDDVPFAKGGLRKVYHIQDLSIEDTPSSNDPAFVHNHQNSNSNNSNSNTQAARNQSYVAKIAIDPNENPDTYFRDVEMQAVAANFATLYNSYNPPRRVEFLKAWILQLVPDDQDPNENLTLRGTICGVEPFIEGEYHKHNNNYGYVSELERNTPQAFSHFTYEASGRQILVVDIQGVGDHYTDPQIHTKGGKEFGKGNLSVRGFERFLESHRCNAICRYLKLPLNNPKDVLSSNPQGTIPAQTYMNKARVDRVESELCHYYSDSNVFKRYQAKKQAKAQQIALVSATAAMERKTCTWCGVNVCTIS